MGSCTHCRHQSFGRTFRVQHVRNFNTRPFKEPTQSSEQEVHTFRNGYCVQTTLSSAALVKNRRRVAAQGFAR
jgi:hypothetical protein